ncbi:MAG TPA: chorismate mutase [Candidatus Wallbacteria bacterium]|nr:chorismate mutase [Candidatus Wallbacteria bacterium]
MQSSLKKLRYFIDNIDSLILKLLSKRIKISKKIQLLKPSPVKFSPAREKDILKNCSREATDIYLAILAVSRSWPPGAKWFFMSGGNAVRDDLAMQYFRKIFGAGIKIIKNADIKEILENARNASDNKPVFVIRQGSSKTAGPFEELFFRHADYKKSGRKLFEFCSTAAPDDEKGVTINL